ncbi:hypothetical protein HDV05_008476 [Chytridiales sp. JEL 0842]|nr:hypothetical protein HDV05_008476 [Chytridiales sp. JEL 0842]
MPAGASYVDHFTPPTSPPAVSRQPENKPSRGVSFSSSERPASRSSTDRHRSSLSNERPPSRTSSSSDHSSKHHPRRSHSERSSPSISSGDLINSLLPSFSNFLGLPSKPTQKKKRSSSYTTDTHHTFSDDYSENEKEQQYEEQKSEAVKIRSKAWELESEPINIVFTEPQKLSLELPKDADDVPPTPISKDDDYLQTLNDSSLLLSPIHSAIQSPRSDTAEVITLESLQMWASTTSPSEEPSEEEMDQTWASDLFSSTHSQTTLSFEPEKKETPQSAAAQEPQEESEQSWTSNSHAFSVDPFSKSETLAKGEDEEEVESDEASLVTLEDLKEMMEEVRVEEWEREGGGEVVRAWSRLGERSDEEEEVEELGGFEGFEKLSGEGGGERTESKIHEETLLEKTRLVLDAADVQESQPSTETLAEQTLSVLKEANIVEDSNASAQSLLENSPTACQSPEPFSFPEETRIESNDASEGSENDSPQINDSLLTPKDLSPSTPSKYPPPVEEEVLDITALLKTTAHPTLETSMLTLPLPISSSKIDTYVSELWVHPTMKTEHHTGGLAINWAPEVHVVGGEVGVDVGGMFKQLGDAFVGREERRKEAVCETLSLAMDPAMSAGRYVSEPVKTKSTESAEPKEVLEPLPTQTPAPETSEFKPLESESTDNTPDAQNWVSIILSKMEARIVCKEIVLDLVNSLDLPQTVVSKSPAALGEDINRDDVEVESFGQTTLKGSAKLSVEEHAEDNLVGDSALEPSADDSLDVEIDEPVVEVESTLKVKDGAVEKKNEDESKDEQNVVAEATVEMNDQTVANSNEASIEFLSDIVRRSPVAEEVKVAQSDSEAKISVLEPCSPTIQDQDALSQNDFTNILASSILEDVLERVDTRIESKSKPEPPVQEIQPADNNLEASGAVVEADVLNISHAIVEDIVGSVPQHSAQKSQLDENVETAQTIEDEGLLVSRAIVEDIVEIVKGHVIARRITAESVPLLSEVKQAAVSTDEAEEQSVDAQKSVVPHNVVAPALNDVKSLDAVAELMNANSGLPNTAATISAETDKPLTLNVVQDAEPESSVTTTSVLAVTTTSSNDFSNFVKDVVRRAELYIAAKQSILDIIDSLPTPSSVDNQVSPSLDTIEICEKSMTIETPTQTVQEESPIDSAQDVGGSECTPAQSTQDVENLESSEAAEIFSANLVEGVVARAELIATAKEVIDGILDLLPGSSATDSIKQSPSLDSRESSESDNVAQVSSDSSAVDLAGPTIKDLPVQQILDSPQTILAELVDNIVIRAEIISAAKEAISDIITALPQPTEVFKNLDVVEHSDSCLPVSPAQDILKSANGGTVQDTVDVSSDPVLSTAEPITEVVPTDVTDLPVEAKYLDRSIEDIIDNIIDKAESRVIVKNVVVDTIDSTLAELSTIPSVVNKKPLERGSHLSAIKDSDSTEIVLNPNVPTSKEVQISSYTFNPSNGSLSGQIWVRNIAFVKVVQLFYSDASSLFSPEFVFNATYARAAADGYEVWKFEGSSEKLGPKSEIYVKYDVNGQCYYDGNYIIPCTAPPTQNDPKLEDIAPAAEPVGNVTLKDEEIIVVEGTASLAIQPAVSGDSDRQLSHNSNDTMSTSPRLVAEAIATEVVDLVLDRAEDTIAQKSDALVEELPTLPIEPQPQPNSHSLQELNDDGTLSESTASSSMSKTDEHRHDIVNGLQPDMEMLEDLAVQVFGRNSNAEISDDDKVDVSYDKLAGPSGIPLEPEMQERDLITESDNCQDAPSRTAEKGSDKSAFAVSEEVVSCLESALDYSAVDDVEVTALQLLENLERRNSTPTDATNTMTESMTERVCDISSSNSTHSIASIPQRSIEESQSDLEVLVLELVEEMPMFSNNSMDMEHDAEVNHSFNPTEELECNLTDENEVLGIEQNSSESFDVSANFSDILDDIVDKFETRIDVKDILSDLVTALPIKSEVDDCSLSKAGHVGSQECHAVESIDLKDIVDGIVEKAHTQLFIRDVLKEIIHNLPDAFETSPKNVDEATSSLSLREVETVKDDEDRSEIVVVATQILDDTVNALSLPIKNDLPKSNSKTDACCDSAAPLTTAELDESSISVGDKDSVVNSSLFDSLSCKDSSPITNCGNQSSADVEDTEHKLPILLRQCPLPTITEDDEASQSSNSSLFESLDIDDAVQQADDGSAIPMDMKSRVFSSIHDVDSYPTEMDGDSEAEDSDSEHVCEVTHIVEPLALLPTSSIDTIARSEGILVIEEASTDQISVADHVVDSEIAETIPKDIIGSLSAELDHNPQGIATEGQLDVQFCNSIVLEVVDSIPQFSNMMLCRSIISDLVKDVLKAEEGSATNHMDSVASSANMVSDSSPIENILTPCGAASVSEPISEVQSYCKSLLMAIVEREICSLPSRESPADYLAVETSVLKSSLGDASVQELASDASDEIIGSATTAPIHQLLNVEFHNECQEEKDEESAGLCTDIRSTVEHSFDSSQKTNAAFCREIVEEIIDSATKTISFKDHLSQDHQREALNEVYEESEEQKDSQTSSNAQVEARENKIASLPRRSSISRVVRSIIGFIVDNIVSATPSVIESTSTDRVPLVVGNNSEGGYTGSSKATDIVECQSDDIVENPTHQKSEPASPESTTSLCRSVVENIVESLPVLQTPEFPLSGSDIDLDRPVVNAIVDDVPASEISEPDSSCSATDLCRSVVDEIVESLPQNQILEPALCSLTTDLCRSVVEDIVQSLPVSQRPEPALSGSDIALDRRPVVDAIVDKLPASQTSEPDSSVSATDLCRSVGDELVENLPSPQILDSVLPGSTNLCRSVVEHIIESLPISQRPESALSGSDIALDCPMVDAIVDQLPASQTSESDSSVSATDLCRSVVDEIIENLPVSTTSEPDLSGSKANLSPSDICRSVVYSIVQKLPLPQASKSDITGFTQDLNRIVDDIVEDPSMPQMSEPNLSGLAADISHSVVNDLVENLPVLQTPKSVLSESNTDICRSQVADIVENIPISQMPTPDTSASSADFCRHIVEDILVKAKENVDQTISVRQMLMRHVVSSDKPVNDRLMAEAIETTRDVVIDSPVSTIGDDKVQSTPSDIDNGEISNDESLTSIAQNVESTEHLQAEASAPQAEEVFKQQILTDNSKQASDDDTSMVEAALGIASISSTSCEPTNENVSTRSHYGCSTEKIFPIPTDSVPVEIEENTASVNIREVLHVELGDVRASEADIGLSRIEDKSPDLIISKGNTPITENNSTKSVDSSATCIILETVEEKEASTVAASATRWAPTMVTGIVRDLSLVCFLLYSLGTLVSSVALPILKVTIDAIDVNTLDPMMMGHVLMVVVVGLWVMEIIKKRTV